ncbi:regulatory alcR [Apiospora arundinis]
MRRQGHSCDQCRRSKRACDATPLEDSEYTDLAIFTEDSRQAPKTQPCSYCVRTKKECTINWAWAQMRIRRALEAADSCGIPPPVDESCSSKRQKLDSTDSRFAPQPLSPDPILGLSHSIGGDLSGPTHFTDGTPAYESQTSTVNNTHFDPFPIDQPFEDDLSLAEWEAIIGLSGDGRHPEHREFDTFDVGSGDGNTKSPGSVFWSDFHTFSEQTHDQLQWGTDADRGLDATYFSPITPISFDATSTASNRDTHARFGKPARKRRRTPQPRSRGQQQAFALSSLAANHRIAASTNENLISSNLLRIYHDVLEHSLSCWLTEVSCPYRPRSVPLQERVKSAEWGPSWSNRLYYRTLKLEEAAKQVRLVQLSPSEDRACSRALHLAIMAFATQWAQGSRRQNERYSPTPTMSGYGMIEDSSIGGLADEFDREIQWHFWTQAERALQEMSDVDSFRLACAESILGLVQKPSGRETEVSWSAEIKAKSRQRRRRKSEPDELVFEIAQAISQDGPPKYMERAARRMHTLKFRFDSAKHGVLPRSHGSKDEAMNNPVLSMSEDDQTSVGLLYWLAVMFDTVSSSVHHRPLVVPDQECQHQDCTDEDADNPRWRIDLFVQDQLDSPAQCTQWPCTYEELAETVTKSGPVKVLLYRHVAWLQTSLRRGQKGERIEEIVRSAMSLHRYWNATYGQLFRELVRDFSRVPGRVQSWFVCISGHYHLAALLLADLIETVDNQGLGSTEAAEQRLRDRAVAGLRDASAEELSDLARVATPSHHDVDGAGSAFTEPQLPDFHPSVNEGTILTDPWTIILIQAFSKAAVHFLGKADAYPEYVLAMICGDGVAETIRRARDCVKGLWLLGKKSDMARKVADILSEELSFYQSDGDAFSPLYSDDMGSTNSDHIPA